MLKNVYNGDRNRAFDRQTFDSQDISPTDAWPTDIRPTDIWPADIRPTDIWPTRRLTGDFGQNIWKEQANNEFQYWSKLYWILHRLIEEDLPNAKFKIQTIMRA